MSWHFLQGQVVASWEDACLDGAPDALLKLMPTLARYCLKDKQTDFSNPSPYGMTLRRLTGGRGEEVLMWYQGDSPVRTYRPQDGERESTANEADCGPSTPGSLARYNPHSYGWRTAQCSLFGGLTEYSETFPRWGMMRHGELFPLPTPALRTSENESGFWAMPNSRDWKDSGPTQGNRKSPNLGTVVHWPTPRAGNPGSRPNGKGGKILAEEVKKSLFPTPRAEDSQSCGAHRGNPDTLSAFTKLWPTPKESAAVAMQEWPTPRTKGMCGGTGAWQKLNEATDQQEARLMGAGNGGQLNPTWVEWLMGWPPGWTDIASKLEEPKGLGETWWEIEPPIPRVARNVPSRVDRLRCIGNGQVPQAMALAFRTLDRIRCSK